MTALLRFAPSPTGYLHVGNIRTALVNWLYVKKQGGRFCLRLDDTDQERSKPEFTTAIKEDMEWLGLKWDEFFKQSDRYADYENAKRKLIASGRLYPCYETAEELDIKRKMAASRGAAPVYDRAALKLTDEQKKKYESEGRKPHYRFLLEGKDIVWNDMIRGEVKFTGGHVSDPVLVREDGVPLYTLASVVDDGDTGVTHVIRGEDHVSNTAVQIQIFEALGYKAPTFGHLALLKTKEGELSKRVGGNDIRSLRSDGFEPMALMSYLAKIGTSDAIDAFPSMEALTASFDISKFGRSPANYDEAELERINQKLVHGLEYAAVKDRIQGDANFWNSVRANLKKVGDASEWWNIINHYERPANVEKEFLSQAAEVLPQEPWSDASWNEWTNAVKEKTGKKGKELFMPLRIALTGMEHGPEMKQLFLLLGREKVLTRLR